MRCAQKRCNEAGESSLLWGGGAVERVGSKQSAQKNSDIYVSAREKSCASCASSSVDV